METLNESNKVLYEKLSSSDDNFISVKNQIRSNKKRLKKLIRKNNFLNEMKKSINLKK